MPKVFFLKHSIVQNLPSALKKAGIERFRGKRVAVKLHMGEYGNLNYVRPPIAGRVIEALKEAGAKPFLFDSTTLYAGSRFTPEGYLDTARKNGFTEETMGCPILVSNDSVQKKGKLFPVGVIKEAAEAGALLVLTHCKGHPFSGMGGAIKNLGMGCVDSKTKKTCHSKALATVDVEKCIGCAACEKACEFGAIAVKGGKASVETASCWGCGKCWKACPQDAIKPKELEPDDALASCALEVLKCFSPESVLFVNVLMDLSSNCDCAADAPLPKTPSIGVLVSQNILAIDSASVDLINKSHGTDFFDALGYRNPKKQVAWLESQGFGKPDYGLEEM